METILIRPDLLELVKKGQKVTTCRLGIRSYPFEKTILKSNDSDDFIYIEVVGISYYKFKNITNKQAKDDGFKNKQQLLEVMQDIYGEITDDTDISIVHFSLWQEPDKGFEIRCLNCGSIDCSVETDGYYSYEDEWIENGFKIGCNNPSCGQTL